MSSFDWFFVHRLRNSKYWPFPTYYPMGSGTSIVSQKNTMVINFVQSRVRSRVSIGFSCIISKIQNTSHSQRLALGKSYEHGLMKKHDGHILCVT
ncbi:hypothetical protein BHM03_00035517 [Ensete ventricosum]|nr:hypothetical protein BHM03_00035517 [Ensete ventricosum]